MAAALALVLPLGLSQAASACPCGDLDADGQVTLNDFVTFTWCFGLTEPAPDCGSAEWLCSDLDADGQIDLSDFVVFAGLFGQPATSSPPGCLADPGGPSAEFTVAPNPAQVRDAIEFRVSAPSDEVLYYLWSFSDGGTGFGEVFARSFADPGEYTASLIAQCSDGEVLSSEQTVTVERGLHLVGMLEGSIELPKGLVVSNNVAWAVGLPGRFAAANVSNPATPWLVADRSLAGLMYDVAATDALVAVAAGSAGIYLFDAAAPESLGQELGHFDTYEFDGSYAFGAAFAPTAEILYATSGWVGLRVLDVSVPSEPRLLTTLDGLGCLKRMLVLDGRAYIVDVSVPGIRVFDLSIPEQPAPLAVIPTEEQPLDLCVQDGSLLGVAEGSGGVEFFDISNPEQPVFLSRAYDQSDGVRGVALIGRAAYVSYGFTVVEMDISDPQDPRTLEYVSLGNNAYMLRVLDNLIYASLGQGVVAVLEP